MGNKKLMNLPLVLGVAWEVQKWCLSAEPGLGLTFGRLCMWAPGMS